jgi:hypothetical protein
MHWTCSLPIAFFALLCALPAYAEDAPPAEKPTPKVAQVFEYAKRYVTVDCKRWEVKDVNKDGYTLIQCGDYIAYVEAETGTLAKIVKQDGAPVVEFKPHSPTLSFPLQIGKKWQGDYDGYRASASAKWKSHVTCEVKSFETVKVAAGEFQAYRIDCEDAWESTPFHGFSPSVSWYAPKIGSVVKSTNASQSDFDFELTSYAGQ